MAAFLQDLSFALRGLRKRPGFLIAALAIVALGIGANVTVFTIVNAMLLRPLPFGQRSERLLTLHSTHRTQREDWDWGDSALSYRDLMDLAPATTLDGVAGYLPRNLTLAGDDTTAERVQGGSVTPNLFALLGAEPLLGRTFAADEGAAPGLESSVILTHGLWRRRYGADPAIIGRSVVVNERARTVVGVMPPNFKFPERDEIYLPLRWDDAARGVRATNGIALLAEGATRTQAQAEIDAIATRLAEAYPDSNRGFGIRALPFRESLLAPQERDLTLALMGAVALVLLIACANLANLLLVRGAARQREIAVRAAMGASRWRIVSSVIAESAVLAGCGAVMGLLAAQWALDALIRSFPEELPYWLRFEIDLRVVAFTTAATLLTAIAVGLLPALRAARLDIVEDLRATSRTMSLGRSAQRVQGGLAVGQVALCLALLVGANLMIRSFLALQNADLGFDHRPMLSARAYLAGDSYDSVAARAAFFANATSVLSGLPGVEAAAATTSIPGDDGGSTVRLVIDGQATSDEDLRVSTIGVTSELFSTLGLSFVDGRSFSPGEISEPDAGVAVLNIGLANRLWPDQRAVDRRVGIRAGDHVRWLRVIGIVPDVHYEEIGEETATSRLNVYVPYAASGSRTMALLVRAGGPPSALIQPVRDALRRLSPGVPLFDVMSMAERRRYTTWEQEFFGEMMGAFAAAALLLACLGIYALLAYATRRRTHEIGVRLALGAAPRDVVRLFVGQAGRIGVAGLLVGLGLAVATARVIRGALFAVDALDPWLFAGMSGALLAIVLLAGYLPARRASRVDPMLALRME
jgi:putative ABC transport system permease protein